MPVRRPRINFSSVGQSIFRIKKTACASPAGGVSDGGAEAAAQD
jgi:hypothetical protein